MNKNSVQMVPVRTIPTKEQFHPTVTTTNVTQTQLRIPVVANTQPLNQVPANTQTQLRMPVIANTQIQHRMPAVANTQVQHRMPVVTNAQTKPTVSFPLGLYYSGEKEITKPVEIETAIRTRLENTKFEIYNPIWRNDELNRAKQHDTPAAYSAAIQQHLLKINTYYHVGWLMEGLMVVNDPLFTTQVLQQLGYTLISRSPATPDVHYNLLWYLQMAGPNNIETGAMIQQLNYISNCSIDQLRTLLGPKYNGPTDQASLIFAAVTGKSASGPDITNIPRYNKIAALPSWLVWTVAMNLYKVIDIERRLISIYPPYIHWTLQDESPIDSIIFAITEQNIDYLMTAYQIPLPTHLPLTIPIDKIKYFVKEITQYEPVLARAPNIIPPPMLIGQTIPQINNMLSVYTLKELVDAYEPTGTWFDRQTLIDTIANEARGGGSRWSWRHRYCNNDDTINILMGELHSEVNKDDPNDPTLSYGVQKNYRCYQVSELTAAFREYDGGFRFRVPDWTPNLVERPQTINPTTRAPLIADFPIESIHQLQQLLRTPPPGYNVTELVDKIFEGLNTNIDAVRRLRAFKTQYNAFTPEQQYLARLYLAWLFIYGMRMRFWKGPGFPWPTFAVNVLDAIVRQQEHRCSPEDRDEHSFIQQAIRTVFLETYEKDPALRRWIESLPEVRYNFTTGEAYINANPIVRLLDDLTLGNVCQGVAGDHVTETAYFLITRMFNIGQKEMFDAFIAESLPAILEIERQVVNNQLVAIKNPNANPTRVRILRERQAALAQPIPKLPPFEPKTVKPNVHT